ncbi:unnamed protein product, partial [Closterium sp. NIES-54]
QLARGCKWEDKLTHGWLDSLLVALSTALNNNNNNNNYYNNNNNNYNNNNNNNNNSQLLLGFADLARTFPILL